MFQFPKFWDFFFRGHFWKVEDAFWNSMEWYGGTPTFDKIIKQPQLFWGQRFIYSNMQWAVVELAVQRATSLDWPTAAQKFLFHPLGLSKNTYYRSEDKPACHQTRHSSIFEAHSENLWTVCGEFMADLLKGIMQSCSTHQHPPVPQFPASKKRNPRSATCELESVSAPLRRTSFCWALR